MSPFPDGHFYSPVVDPTVIETRRGEIWPPSPPEMSGLDFNDTEQRLLLEKDFPHFMAKFQYPEDENDVERDYDYCTANGQFSGLDARALFVMLQKYRPQRMIEVGSGFSSLLTADVNRNYLDGQLNFSCIEPYPRDFSLNMRRYTTHEIRQNLRCGTCSTITMRLLSGITMVASKRNTAIFVQ